MMRLHGIVIVSILAALAVTGCEEQAVTEAAPAEIELAGPINEVRADGLVADWMVMVFNIKSGGEREQDEEYFIKTFDADYLAPIGGEAKAVLTAKTVVPYKDESGQDQKATASQASADAIGWLSSEWDEASAGRRIAYAYCVLKSDKPQKVKLYFGSDDEGKIWVNGELVHKTYDARSCESRQDTVTVDLKKGLNSMLVKTSQRSVSWVFALEAYAAK